MAEFQATPEDLAEIIHRQQRAVFKQQARYPALAALAAALFFPLWPPAGWLGLGMSVAWALSTYWAVAGVPDAYLWRYAWLQEGIVLDVLEDGVRLSNQQKGSSFIRWWDGIKVVSLSTCFIVEDGDEDVLVIPKRYLDSAELLLLRNRAA